jgi:uncharacterized membrane protein
MTARVTQEAAALETSQVWESPLRLASDVFAGAFNPSCWRIAHAVLLEATSAIVTWPLIVALTDLGWGAALAADVLLTFTYALYSYVFHLGFDRLRPVR